MELVLRFHVNHNADPPHEDTPWEVCPVGRLSKVEEDHPVVDDVAGCKRCQTASPANFVAVRADERNHLRVGVCVRDGDDDRHPRACLLTLPNGVVHKRILGGIGRIGGCRDHRVRRLASSFSTNAAGLLNYICVQRGVESHPVNRGLVVLGASRGTAFPLVPKRRAGRAMVHNRDVEGARVQLLPRRLVGALDEGILAALGMPKVHDGMIGYY
mmetsp:Transcript_45578/g.151107  ORF Transcript_45578/g.151107 Transcript_45578/m.151107 type:complete len:214 (+) Transcript_45578:1115-1756(+)